MDRSKAMKTQSHLTVIWSDCSKLTTEENTRLQKHKWEPLRALSVSLLNSAVTLMLQNDVMCEILLKLL